MTILAKNLYEIKEIRSGMQNEKSPFQRTRIFESPQQIWTFIKSVKYLQKQALRFLSRLPP